MLTTRNGARYLLALWGSVFVAHAHAAQDQLIVESTIPLGPVAGRIDHLAYDSTRERLYVAELGNNTVGVVDLKNHRLLKTVTGFDEPQGIGYEPTTDIVYVSNGGDGTVRIFNGEDFAPLGQIALGSDADNVRVDATTHRIYVGHGNGALAVIDAASRKRVANIPLKGHPEGFQLEATGRRIFINVPDARVIEVVSRDTHESIASWPVSTLRANYPLIIDEPNHRVLAAFRQPARLESFDLNDGRRLGGVDACADADDLFVDPRRSYVYVICGEGKVDTYSMTGKAFRRVSQIDIPRGSRTGLFLPEINRLVVAGRASDQAAAAVLVMRPAPADDTQHRGEVLIACEHGNVKSLMAASYFNQLAKARNLPFRAIARGTAPDSNTVPAVIIAGLQAEGFNVSDFHPSAMTAIDVTSADRVILINTDLPSDISGASSRIEKWTDIPPASTNYAAASEALKAHVRALLDQLAITGSPPH